MDFNPDMLVLLLEQDLGTPVGELRTFRSDALKKSILKKYVPHEKQSDLHVAALERFKALNEEVKNFSLHADFLTSDLFLEWRRVINDSFYSGTDQAPRITLAGAFANGLCGPGASVGASSTLFFSKLFDSHLTVTSGFLYEHYLHSLSPRWSRAESLRLLDYTVKVVPGSKMSSVPKDRTKNRTTCTEPILNMFYQLGIKTQIESVLLDRFNLNLSTQPDINKRLARDSSIDGSLATIDLKDASDTISVALCSALLPPQLMRLLMYTRSAHTHVGTELVPLSMISTMGNGFTFALMTWLFTSLVRAIYNTRGIKFSMGVNVGVFGDDIIIDGSCVDVLYGALSSAGFVVNETKSFSEGPFRESCGGDYFHGEDVRGVYIKEFNHETHCYSAFNRLHFWAVRHDFDLTATLQYLKGLAPFRPVPYDVGVDAGFVVTTRQLTSPKTGRYGAIKYHCLRFVPKQWEKCGDRFRNHHGGLIAFLGGYVRDDKMSLRVSSSEKASRYSVIAGETPCWDFITDPELTTRGLDESWCRILIR